MIGVIYQKILYFCVSELTGCLNYIPNIESLIIYQKYENEKFVMLDRTYKCSKSFVSCRSNKKPLLPENKWLENVSCVLFRLMIYLMVISNI
jgi:hypothetical protein